MRVDSFQDIRNVGVRCANHWNCTFKSGCVKWIDGT